MSIKEFVDNFCGRNSVSDPHDIVEYLDEHPTVLKSADAVSFVL